MCADNDEFAGFVGWRPVAVFKELSDGVADAQAGVGVGLDFVELELAVSTGDEVDEAALSVVDVTVSLDPTIMEIAPQLVLESPMLKRDICLYSLPGCRRASGACVVLQRVIRFEDKSSFVVDGSRCVVRFAVALDELVDWQERVEVLQNDVNDVFVECIDPIVFAEENEVPAGIEVVWHGLGRVFLFGCPIPLNSESALVQVVGVILEKSAKPAELRVHLSRVGHRPARL